MSDHRFYDFYIRNILQPFVIQFQFFFFSLIIATEISRNRGNNYKISLQIKFLNFIDPRINIRFVLKNDLKKTCFDVIHSHTHLFRKLLEIVPNNDPIHIVLELQFSKLSTFRIAQTNRSFNPAAILRTAINTIKRVSFKYIARYISL